MTPQEELTYWKSFIKLKPHEAVKRDMLEDWISNRDKIALLDSDSLAYNVASFWINKEHNIEEMFQDFCEQRQNIILAIEESGINVVEIYHYFTTCSNNFRYKLCKDYKANRVEDPVKKLARKLVSYTIHRMEELEWAFWSSNDLEADDGIAKYVSNDNAKNVITVSIDKDLKQVLGAHFDYYKVKTGELDVWDEPIKEYRGWSFTSPQESYDMFLEQLAMGDKSDNVKGGYLIGEVKAKEMLEGKTNFGKLLAVARAYRVYNIKDKDGICKQKTLKQYQKHKGLKTMSNDMDRLRKNVKLMRL